jgi:hypothetical protein
MYIVYIYIYYIYGNPQVDRNDRKVAHLEVFWGKASSTASCEAEDLSEEPVKPGLCKMRPGESWMNKSWLRAIMGYLKHLRQNTPKIMNYISYKLYIDVMKNFKMALPLRSQFFFVILS